MTPDDLERRDPVDELARARALAQAAHLADLVERVDRLLDQRFVELRVMHAHDARISSCSGKSMKWNTQRRRNASGSSFSLFEVMITTGRCLRHDLFARLADEEAHAVELVQQVVRELEVRLVDLVDQQHHALARRRTPARAARA